MVYGSIGSNFILIELDCFLQLYVSHLTLRYAFSRCVDATIVHFPLTGYFLLLPDPTFSPRCAIGASGRRSSRSSQAELLCVSNELNNESGSTSSAVADPESNISKTIEKGSSKWQHKGKRNSRHTKKTPTNETDDKQNTSGAAKEEHLDGFDVGSDQKLAEDGSNELDSTPRLLPFRRSRLTVHSKYQRSEFSFTKLGCNASLYDVEVMVKANYRPQHVPLVSLMSELNCKAIIGHPLTIEVLEDGHCDELSSRSELDPRSVESSRSVQSSSLKGKTSGKRHARAFQPRSSTGKALKTKNSGQLSKKTRKLSSLTVEKQFVDESKSKGAFIACIPLKVVFGRLNDAVDGLARPRIGV